MSETTTEQRIAAASLTRRLPGVLGALNVAASGGHLQLLSEFFRVPLAAGRDASSRRAKDGTQAIPAADSSLTLKGWEEAISSVLTGDGGLKPLARLVLGISYLCEQPAESTSVDQEDLDSCWGFIRDGLRAGFMDGVRVSRSSQGFLTIPLCYLSSDGNIDELFRLHVWLPDSQRGDPQTAIHSHQAFGRSWVLAGEGKDTPFRVERVADPAGCNYSEYRLTWTSKQGTGTSYTTEQISSTIENSGQPVRVEAGESEVHSRGMTYTVAAASFHISEVAPRQIHATLFLFDSRHGFVKDAPVLGPIANESFTHIRDSKGISPGNLVDIVEDIRSWETFMSTGRAHITRARHEYALREFDSALNACNLNGTSNGTFTPDVSYYQCQAHAARGQTNRRFGRYDQAKNDFQLALSSFGTQGPSLDRVSWTGELGVVYRHTGLLKEAQDAFRDQYEMAKQLQDDREMCRAIGNEGAANFQRFLLQPEPREPSLLATSMTQQNERVERARMLLMKGDISSRQGYQATAWLLIGLSRLSLCFTELGDHERSASCALEALQLVQTLQDSTMLGQTRFFYGRALMKGGRPSTAYYALFNPPDGATPAAALCKEPSEENRGYLEELVEAGAVMDRADEHGYTALDYAIFAGDEETERIVLNGINKRLQTESRIRKSYRELFQEHLRPVLTKHEGGNAAALLRQAYTTALEKDAAARGFFDRLKSIKYADFCNFGRLPRSSDGLAQAHEAHPGGDEFLVFMSYRWINKDKKAMTPDDQAGTQYQRMLASLDTLLTLHPEVSRDKLHVWMDFACVDQDNPTKGVNALPLIATQCNAFISLVDHEYYSRAWCCVEVVIAQAITRAFNAQYWYEHVQEGDEAAGTLQLAAPDMPVLVADKALTNEVDRPSVLFLERQSKLLG